MRIPKELPGDVCSVPEFGQKPRSVIQQQAEMIKQKNAKDTMSFDGAGLGGRSLWVKPRRDAMSEADHFKLSVGEICRNIDELDHVRKYEQAMSAKRTPYNRFCSRMIKELVYNQRMDFKQAQRAISD